MPALSQADHHPDPARPDEMVKAQVVAVGLATGARGIGPIAGYSETRNMQLPTLAEAGIDKNLAHRARQLECATDMRLLATRRLDEMVKAQAATVGLNHGG